MFLSFLPFAVVFTMIPHTITQSWLLCAADVLKTTGRNQPIYLAPAEILWHRSSFPVVFSSPAQVLKPISFFLLEMK